MRACSPPLVGLAISLLGCGGATANQPATNGSDAPRSARTTPHHRHRTHRSGSCEAPTPSARTPWIAPSGLDPRLAEATALLISYGFPDARGLEIRPAAMEIDPFAGNAHTIRGPSWIWTREGSTEHWALTPRGDLLVATELGEALPLEQMQMPPVEHGIDAPEYVTRIAARESRELGEFGFGALSAIVLARLGHVDDANAQWSQLTERQGVPPLETAIIDFAELYFDAGFTAFLHGHDALAEFHWSRLACARPAIVERLSHTRIENPPVADADSALLGFLDRIEPLLRDVRRRIAATRPAATPSLTDRAALAAADVPTLLRALEDLRIEREDERALVENPLAAAIIARGPSIVPAIIDALETDERLTRTGHFVSRSMDRGVFPVRAILGQLLTTITGMYGVEFGWRPIGEEAAERPHEVARVLRERWATIGSLSPAERAIRALEDDSITQERRILALAQLFAAPPGMESHSMLFLRGTRFAVIDLLDANALGRVTIDPALRARLLAAVQRRIQPLQPISRTDEATQRDESLRCAWGQMLYGLDARAATPMLRETVERQFARDSEYAVTDCVSWLSRALLANGDASGATTFARRLRELQYRPGELRIVAHEWLTAASRPEAAAVFDALASHVRSVALMSAGVPGQPQSTIYVPDVLSIVDADTIHVPEIRDAVAAHFGDLRTTGFIQIIPEVGQAMLFNASGAHPLELHGDAQGADFIQSGAMVPFRIADMMAYLVAEMEHVQGAPAFDPRWVNARRDRALAEFRRWISTVTVIAREAPAARTRR